jgi:hypothetical protein
MRPRKKYDQSEIGAAIIGGLILVGVMGSAMVPDRFVWVFGAVLLLPVALVVAWACWAVLTTLFRGLR